MYFAEGWKVNNPVLRWHMTRKLTEWDALGNNAAVAPLVALTSTNVHSGRVEDKPSFMHIIMSLVCHWRSGRTCGNTRWENTAVGLQRRGWIRAVIADIGQDMCGVERQGSFSTVAEGQRERSEWAIMSVNSIKMMKKARENMWMEQVWVKVSKARSGGQ